MCHKSVSQCLRVQEGKTSQDSYKSACIKIGIWSPKTASVFLLVWFLDQPEKGTNPKKCQDRLTCARLLARPCNCVTASGKPRRARSFGGVRPIQNAEGHEPRFVGGGAFCWATFLTRRVPRGGLHAEFFCHGTAHLSPAAFSEASNKAPGSHGGPWKKLCAGEKKKPRSWARLRRSQQATCGFPWGPLVWDRRTPLDSVLQWHQSFFSLSLGWLPHGKTVLKPQKGVPFFSRGGLAMGQLGPLRLAQRGLTLECIPESYSPGSSVRLQEAGCPKESWRVPNTYMSDQAILRQIQY